MPYQSESQYQTIARGFEYCVPKYAMTGAAVDVGALVAWDANADLVPRADGVTGTGTVRVAYPRRERGMSELATTPTTGSRDDPDTFAAGEEAAYVIPPAGAECLLNVEGEATTGSTLDVGDTVNGSGTGGNVIIGGPGPVVGDVVAPDKADDPGTWSQTIAAGAVEKALVEIR